jgi:hypothetical protein
MATKKNNAWSAAQSAATLEELRENYPGYTDNELYAIWCHEHGLIPLDSNQKLDLDLWRMHAAEDGQHVADEGFKVSRAIYGRALKAERGIAKPKQGPRKSAHASDGEAHFNENGMPLSVQALEFARSFDRANRLLHAALVKQAEALSIAEELRGTDPVVLEALSNRNEGARALLEYAGVLSVAPELG